MSNKININIPHIIRKEYTIMFNQYKPSPIKIHPPDKKREREIEIISVKNNFKFIGAQPLQYTGEDTVEVTKSSVVFSPKIDGERRLLVITDKGFSGFISRNGDGLPGAVWNAKPPPTMVVPHG
mgnify:CR=1 FL=1